MGTRNGEKDKQNGRNDHLTRILCYGGTIPCTIHTMFNNTHPFCYAHRQVVHFKFWLLWVTVYKKKMACVVCCGQSYAQVEIV